MPANLPPGLPIVPDGAGDTSGFEMSEADFEAAVSDALDQLPSEVARAKDNVAVFIDDDYVPQQAKTRTPCCWDCTRAFR
jgi:hypothetical protein